MVTAGNKVHLMRTDTWETALTLTPESPPVTAAGFSSGSCELLFADGDKVKSWNLTDMQVNFERLGLWVVDLPIDGEQASHPTANGWDTLISEYSRASADKREADLGRTGRIREPGDSQ
jgi:hypothetical protein